MPNRRKRFKDARLYALLTERHCRLPWRETAELLLAGGVDVIQLREKELPDGELLHRASVLREITSQMGALLIINDRADIALLTRADGVHVGQADLPPQDVRTLIGSDMLIGWSTHSIEQARQACELPVDYVAVGPVAATVTKGYKRGKGVRLVRDVCSRCAVSGLPVVAIGGITLDNAAAAVEAGVTAVAACSALCGADDPMEAAHELRTVVEEAGKRRSEPNE